MLALIEQPLAQADRTSLSERFGEVELEGLRRRREVVRQTKIEHVMLRSIGSTIAAAGGDQDYTTATPSGPALSITNQGEPP